MLAVICGAKVELRIVLDTGNEYSFNNIETAKKESRTVGTQVGVSVLPTKQPVSKSVQHTPKKCLEEVKYTMCQLQKRRLLQKNREEERSYEKSYKKGCWQMCGLQYYLEVERGHRIL